MRNITNVIAAITTALVMTIVPALPGFCSITNWDVETAASTYVTLAGAPIRYEGSVSDEDVQAALIGWYETPEELRTIMTEIGTVIYVSDSASTDTATVGSAGNFWKKVNGVYSIKQSYIVVRTQNDDITETVLHEIGHVIDQALTLLSRQDGSTASRSAEWTAIYSAEKENLSRIDYQSMQNMYNTAEAFAETYRLYIEKPNELLSAAPAAHAFMANLLMEYTSSGEAAT